MDEKLAKQISAQRKKLDDERKKLQDLESKVEEVETKRFQRIAKKIGLYDAKITDAEFENTLKRMVDAAESPLQTATEPA